MGEGETVEGKEETEEETEVEQEEEEKCRYDTLSNNRIRDPA